MATAAGAYAMKPNKSRSDDPYTYQVGFGNSFASEAIPGALPVGQNSPQKNAWGLYAEQVTATAFVAPRHSNQKLWLYRMRPSVAHQGFIRLPDNPDLVADFSPSSNPKVTVSPTQVAWRPFPLPSDNDKVDFVDGIKTVAGTGEPMKKEGLAIHVYVCNTSMEHRAFCNNDGDMLIVPQQGRLDIQTELGRMMVKPGEICIIQRGLRFKVVLPDGPSRGYIQEAYGAHYKLPELGPLGANGLANARDFEHPIAAFDIDQSGWEIVYKLMVCVLTVDSVEPGTPMADFLIFSPRWDVASHTFRPPYFHRNSASEFMGLIMGNYGGRSDDFLPGGASYECGFTPHGVDYEVWKQASEMKQDGANWISDGTYAFMFESCRPFTLTEYATEKCGTIHYHEPKMWDPLESEFIERLDEVNKHLESLGLPKLDKGNAQKGNKGLPTRRQDASTNGKH
ncbi:hypothetical protein OIV83_001718 [Microbotryomycetes sp. JL201]|nr:hypothetical protein OIV83_001718 [Microbotryomycetes sp. JL201]